MCCDTLSKLGVGESATFQGVHDMAHCTNYLTDVTSTKMKHLYLFELQGIE